MNLIEKIIYALQYEITRPKSYGLFHIGCIFISIVLLIYLIKRKEQNKEISLKKILYIYGFGALVLEILKQIVWSFNYDSVLNTVTWDYQWYAFPFQLCTTPIFASIICIYLKKEKTRNSLLSYMAFTTILGSLATAIYPESCYVKMLLIDIHTMYLHFGSLIVSLYLLITHEIDTKLKNLLSGYNVFIIFALVAEIMNIIMYNSSILGDETFNMFYISPYFISTLPIYDIIQSNTPFIVFILIYLLTIFIGSLIIWLVTKYIDNIITKLKNKEYKKF